MSHQTGERKSRMKVKTLARLRPIHTFEKNQSVKQLKRKMAQGKRRKGRPQTRKVHVSPKTKRKFLLQLRKKNSHSNRKNKTWEETIKKWLHQKSNHKKY